MVVSSKLIDIMRERAKARQKLSPGRPSEKGRVNLPEVSDNIVPFPAESAQVRDEIAKAAGVSPKMREGG